MSINSAVLNTSYCFVLFEDNIHSLHINIAGYLACKLVLQVFDDCALSQPVKDELYKCYPNAKRAHLKKGGNFPYLCRSADVNLYLQVCA